MINYDDSRRDITIETSPGPRTQSRLIIREPQIADSGNYTCSASNTEPASIYVFVSKGNDCRLILQRNSITRSPVCDYVPLPPTHYPSSVRYWSICCSVGGTTQESIADRITRHFINTDRGGMGTGSVGGGRGDYDYHAVQCPNSWKSNFPAGNSGSLRRPAERITEFNRRTFAEKLSWPPPPHTAWHRIVPFRSIPFHPSA